LEVLTTVQAFWLQYCVVKGVPLFTEPGISLTLLPLMRILQRNLKRTTDTFLFISHTANVLLFKFRCNIFIGVRIIKEMQGSVASGTHYMITITGVSKWDSTSIVKIKEFQKDLNFCLCSTLKFETTNSSKIRSLCGNSHGSYPRRF